MKLKELERPAVQAWSPASQYPVYLATGTSAQQLDASFSTNATLEIFEIDFRDSSLDLKHKEILSVSSRFHKLIWGSFGHGLQESAGVIAGGGDNGLLTLYNVTHILSSGQEPLIAQRQKHTGAVRALDFNPFQGNILASGASDSEIFIWDLNNLSVPMTPGSKSQMNCSGLAWHPDIATQLVLCSEDDRLPVIQLWDLRFASSPLTVLESHSRGILSMSWSQADAELLLSSAKDNQIFCWNLASSEVVYKLPTQNSWCFDVQWCPQNPPVFSAVSFDGWISLYSVMGRSWEVQHRQANKTSSSFSKGQPLPVLQVPEPVAQASLIPPLKKPPKWMRRPAGVSFAFGGKLITFGLPSNPVQQMPQPCPHPVYISQVITESEFLTRSAVLQEALGSGNLLSYCQSKIQQASPPCEKMLWQFLKVTSEHDSRLQFLRLLGFSKDELQRKVDACLKRDLKLGGSPSQFEAVDLKSDGPHTFCHKASKHTAEEASASSAFFDELVPQNMTPWEIPTTEDSEGLLSQALLLGELWPAVELCMKEERFADAIILAQAGGAELLKWTQEHYLAKRRTKISPLLACVIKKNWRDLVCACSLKNWKEALALLLTYSGPENFPELCDMLGTRMELEGGRALTSEARLCHVCSGSVERLVENWEKVQPASCPLALQDLMEKVMVLIRSLELLQGSDKMSPGPATTYRLTQYANLLAAQGSLAIAMSYLPSDCTQPAVQQLRDRLFHAQGSAVLGQQAPTFPFPRVAVGTTLHPKETLSSRLGSQPPHQVPAPSGGPRATAQPSLVMPFTPSYPSPSQGSQLPSTGDYRVPGPQATVPLPFGPGIRSALSQPQLLGGPSVQAANPAGFSGAWPLPCPLPLMASPDTVQPGSPLLPEAARLLPPPPMGPPGPSPLGSLPSACPVRFSTAYPPGGPGASCSTTLPSTGILPPHPGPQDAWQVAPATRENLQRKKLPETVVPPAPITAPVRSLGPQPRQVSSVSWSPPGAPREGSLQLQQLPPGKTERKTLPPEHQCLKDSFEALLQRCSLSATDLKTKRKLEEAAQRLECLYEKLCEGTLSPHVLAGLHEVARCVDAGHFEQGLAVHAQVAGCSSFSEVSSFMPVLKAVLTIAHKLQG
ncbi:protein transport protein Sec31B isoform X2 [Chionomys nivalis]|uniref:protein transport protein Sec31B isoform X2 n=1 Tax=Chionomys nivalis TaxID=269649 RepID=UPI0025954643|nr:protein transport protein Sec31B isoform X2 [Chionomys nivalis]